MSLEQIEAAEKQQNETLIPLANHACIQSPKTAESLGPKPRCLATLPSNIEELILQFKMQESGSFGISQSAIK